MSGYIINDYIFNIDDNMVNVKYSDNYKTVFLVNDSLREYLQMIKTEIDNYTDKWDIYKKITNRYEFINSNINSEKYKNTSVCSYKPISRSYFKMVEILNAYNFNFGDTITSFHLAEGPGGFIEALQQHRHNKKDKYIGMTLINNDCDVPKWNKITNYLKKNKNIHLEYGPKNNGNLYFKYNLEYIQEKYKNSVDFITADGGFDYSVDFNKQEENSINLIFSEVLYALMIQKEHGSFVLKMYDLFHKNTLEILYLLAYFYEKVYVYKPNTSREANSEKYIICTNFTKKGNYYKIMNKLKYNFIDLNKQKLTQIFDFKLNTYYMSKIQEINAIYGQQQIENILTTINYIKEENINNKDKIEKIKLNNIEKCIKWCNNHKQPIYADFLHFPKVC